MLRQINAIRPRQADCYKNDFGLKLFGQGEHHRTIMGEACLMPESFQEDAETESGVDVVVCNQDGFDCSEAPRRSNVG